LNTIGRKQAFYSGRYLNETNWDVIISSPLKRAYKTAEIIRNELVLDDIVLMHDFTERDYGEGSGLKKDEILSKYPDWAIPRQESREQLTNRTFKGIEKVRNNFQNQNVIIVTHGGVINSILSVLSNGEIGARKTILKNACLNQVIYENGLWKIESYNLVDHLEQL
jgi:uncharacterized phosphatase